MDTPPPLPPRPPGYTWRLALGLALILPIPLIPLIVLTVAAFATSDFKQVPIWVGDTILYALPIMSILGFAILPARPWLRVGLGCLIVPILCVLLIIWMIILSCDAFGHCSNWSVV